MANGFEIVSRFVTKNAPSILTGIGVGGVISTTVLAVRATPQAIRDIMDAESERTEPLSKWDKVKLTWQHYIPAAVSGGAAIAAIVGAQSINGRRQTAIMSMYALSERALSEFKEKTLEIVGDKTTKEIKDEIAREHLENVPMVNSEVFVTGKGEHMIFDALSSRYFRSDIETVRRAINDINRQCINQMCASVNDFYTLIGLPRTGLGDDMGWNTDNPLEIEFSSHISESGEPCLSLEYHGRPDQKFGKIW